jgi:Cytochrome c3
MWASLLTVSIRSILVKRSFALKKTGIIFLLLLFFSSTSAWPQAFQHEKITLKGFDGGNITKDSKKPYSPKNTCGTCHNYGRITSGYHFQQDSGIYGKHSLASPDSSQLAKKVNQNPSEIDKSSFFFVQKCGICHPGGGMGEYDRKGNLYYDEEKQKFGYELSGDNPTLDGDYTNFTMGNAGYGAPWNKSGVSEADCLICHLKGYQWKKRSGAFEGGLFKYGPTIGAGWAALKVSGEESGDRKVDEVTVDYSGKEAADFENLHLQIVRKPPDENCWSCHAGSEGKKRGGSWNAETDVHNAKDMGCVSCHPGNPEHNFARGSSMYSCEDCHYKGKDRKAPRYKHPFSPRHMKRIACQICHIPYQSTPADLVYDYASTGEVTVHDTTRFLSGDPLNPRKPPGDDGNRWYPTIREFKGRIVPVKPLIPIYWGDLDEKTNVVKPVFLWKIRELKKPLLRDDDGDGILEINSIDEIKAFLGAISKGKDKFGIPVASHPVLIKGGFLYQLDKKGEVEKIRYEQAHPLDFFLNHNVVSGPAVIGARGCNDCHSKKSPFFLRKVLIDPYDEKGNPVYVENWELLGIDKEKLGRVLLEQ